MSNPQPNCCLITGLRQRHKINAAKWLEWQMFYIQESLLSEQAINTVFVNILLLEDSTACILLQ